MRRALLRCGACWVLWVGCGNDTSSATPTNVAATSVAQPTAKPAVPPPQLYDGAGNLLPSGELVSWLEVPRGLTKLAISAGTFHAYVTNSVPADRIQAFFGARMIAAQVTKLGATGVRLERGIPPSGGKPKQSLIDVSIVPGATPNEVSVRIVENAYVPPLPKFSDADARILMKQEQKSAE